ncbi:hypothetical protein BN946_scf184772.g3 [Trametes cinnabarina]|uniref:DUF6534 domain-containing protein n=1 Tax=Pycnoporus cinnabarinus TaxID=5643 RepID=A0A060SLS1_PYCCI|nr:hypothetical protein BN946_scf184772.g3 [Trametes cinnabarina]
MFALPLIALANDSLLIPIPSLDGTFGAILVSSVLVWETFHTAFGMYTSYHYLVTNYLNPFALLGGYYITMNSPFNLMIICAGLSITSCQTFFMRRVYLLVGGRSKILVASVVVFLIAELGLASAGTAEAKTSNRFIQPTFATFKHFTWIISVAFGMCAVADSILTAFLIYALRRARNGIKRTDNLLDVLVLYAISTGLLTGVFDILSFLFVSRPSYSIIWRAALTHVVYRAKALIQPSNFVWFAINTVATKMYTTSLLAANHDDTLISLNARQMLARQSSGGAAIYGETGPSNLHTLPTRSTFTLGDRWVLARGPRANGANRSADVIEMAVKAHPAFDTTGDSAPQSSVLHMSTKGRAMPRSDMATV